MSNQNIPLVDLPAIVLDKVSKEDILNVLRNAFCKGYMPTATTDRKYNSKPRYERLTEANHLNKLSNFCIAAYDLFTSDEGGFATNEMYAVFDLDLAKVETRFIVCLRSCEIIICYNEEFCHWDDELLLPINMTDFKALVETYI